MFGTSPAPIATTTWPLDPILEHSTLECQFAGKVTEAVSEVLLSALESRVVALNVPRLTGKRILRIAIEMLHNLHHHAPEAHVCGFRVHSSPQGWWIASRNEVDDATQLALVARHAELKALKPEDLRDYQRDVLNADGRSAHGGGGVGLIEIMRRSERNLALNTHPLTGGKWIVELTAYIAASK